MNQSESLTSGGESQAVAPASPGRNVLSNSEQFKLGRYLDGARCGIEANMRDTVETLAAKITAAIGFLVTPSNLRSALEAADIKWPATSRAEHQIRRLWVELGDVKDRLATLERVREWQERSEAAAEHAG